MIKLDAKMVDPGSRRNWKHADIRRWTTDNRGTLVWAVLTLIQAWVVAGKPEGKVTLAGFEPWSHVMGGICDVAGVPGFLGDRAAVKDLVEDSASILTPFINLWWGKFGDDFVAVGRLENEPTLSRGVQDLATLLFANKDALVDMPFLTRQPSAWGAGLARLLGQNKEGVFLVEEFGEVVLERTKGNGAKPWRLVPRHSLD